MRRLPVVAETTGDDGQLSPTRRRVPDESDEDSRLGQDSPPRPRSSRTRRVRERENKRASTGSDWPPRHLLIRVVFPPVPASSRPTHKE